MIELKKAAFIIGIAGPDGLYLSELLLDKGYAVHGMIRRDSGLTIESVEHLYKDVDGGERNLTIHYGDLGDSSSLRRILELVQPVEIYHLAANSDGLDAFVQPEYTVDEVVLGTMRLLEEVNDYQNRTELYVRYYQAGSYEIFGLAKDAVQDVSPSIHPRSPYAVVNAYTHRRAVDAREYSGLFVATGILFDHVSPRSGDLCVARKITRAAARIKRGLQTELVLGNLNARSEWGFTRDYVEAMWLMLQQEQPDDFVIATGVARTVREFVEAAFERVGLDWEKYVKVDPRCLLPSEVDLPVGDPTKAMNVLGWSARTTLAEVVDMMVTSDLEHARREEESMAHWIS